MDSCEEYKKCRKCVSYTTVYVDDENIGEICKFPRGRFPPLSPPPFLEDIKFPNGKCQNFEEIKIPHIVIKNPSKPAWPEHYIENVGITIKRRRGEKGIRDVSKEIGISPATLSRIENGKMPNVKTYLKCALWLDPSLKDIFTKLNNNSADK